MFKGSSKDEDEAATGVKKKQTKQIQIRSSLYSLGSRGRKGEKIKKMKQRRKHLIKNRSSMDSLMFRGQKGGGCDSDEKSDKESVQVGFPGVSGAKWGEKKNKAK